LAKIVKKFFLDSFAGEFEDLNKNLPPGRLLESGNILICVFWKPGDYDKLIRPVRPAPLRTKRKG
jgi:hypothetical protein